MLEYILCLVLFLAELLVAVAIPGYKSLKLVSKKSPYEGEDKDRQYKLWSFYWVLIVFVWSLFTYLEFIPYYNVLRLLLTVALISPKINLLGMIFDSVFDEELIKAKFQQAKEFVDTNVKKVQS